MNEYEFFSVAFTAFVLGALFGVALVIIRCSFYVESKDKVFEQMFRNSIRAYNFWLGQGITKEEFYEKVGYLVHTKGEDNDSTSNF